MPANEMQQATVAGSTSIGDYLHCDPDCTKWRKEYCRITSFAMEPLQVSFSANTWNHRAQAEIPRNCDVLENIVCRLVLPALPNPANTLVNLGPPVPTLPSFQAAANNVSYYVDAVGIAAMRNVQFKVGQRLAQEIDRYALDGHMQLLAHHYDQFASLVGARPRYLELGAQLYRILQLNTGTDPWINERIVRAITAQSFWIHIPLFFTRCSEHGLPVAGLLYNELMVLIEWETFGNLRRVIGAQAFAEPTTVDAELVVLQVFTDLFERRLLSKSVLEYLVENVHAAPANQIPQNSTVYTVLLHFNFPAWAIQFVLINQTSFNNTGEYLDSYANGFDDDGRESFATAALRMNGNVRIEALPASYYSRAVPVRYGRTLFQKPIYYINFATELGDAFEQHGTIHLGQLDSLQIELRWTGTGTTAVYELRVYAWIKNVFRAQMGVGGLKFI